MPAAKARANMERYAREVKPRVDAALPAPAQQAPPVAVPFPKDVASTAVVGRAGRE